MEVYLILLVLLIITLFAKDIIQSRFPGKWTTFVAAMWMVILCFFSCVRSISVGRDTYSYARIFLNISRVSWGQLFNYAAITQQEIGFVIYNKLISCLSIDRQAITIANSILIFALLSKVIFRYSEDPLFSIYIFFTLGLFQTSFNISSSMIAGLFIMNGFQYIISKKPLKYFFVVLAASLFHRSSYIFIPLYFFYKIDVNYKTIVRVVLLSLLCSMLFYPVIYRVSVSILPSIYSRYLERNRGDNGLILIFHLLLIIYSFIFHASTSKTIFSSFISHEKIWIWCIVVELCMFILSLQANAFTRAAYLFTPAILLYLPFMEIKVEEPRYRFFYHLTVIIILVVQYYIRISINNIGHSIPYEFFFNSM